MVVSALKARTGGEGQTLAVDYTGGQSPAGGRTGSVLMAGSVMLAAPAKEAVADAENRRKQSPKRVLAFL